MRYFLKIPGSRVEKRTGIVGVVFLGWPVEKYWLDRNFGVSFPEGAGVISGV